MCVNMHDMHICIHIFTPMCIHFHSHVYTFSLPCVYIFTPMCIHFHSHVYTFATPVHLVISMVCPNCITRVKQTIFMSWYDWCFCACHACCCCCCVRLMCLYIIVYHYQMLSCVCFSTPTHIVTCNYVFTRTTMFSPKQLCSHQNNYALAKTSTCPHKATIPLPKHQSPQIMEILGPSLWDLWNQNCQRLSEQHVACVAVEAISILQQLHAKGYV